MDLLLPAPLPMECCALEPKHNIHSPRGRWVQTYGCDKKACKLSLRAGGIYSLFCRFIDYLSFACRVPSCMPRPLSTRPATPQVAASPSPASSVMGSSMSLHSPPGPSSTTAPRYDNPPVRRLSLRVLTRALPLPLRCFIKIPLNTPRSL